MFDKCFIIDFGMLWIILLILMINHHIRCTLCIGLKHHIIPGCTNRAKQLMKRLKELKCIMFNKDLVLLGKHLEHHYSYLIRIIPRIISNQLVDLLTRRCDLNGYSFQKEVGIVLIDIIAHKQLSMPF